jgi:hypothetical protein
MLSSLFDLRAYLVLILLSVTISRAVSVRLKFLLNFFEFLFFDCLSRPTPPISGEKSGKLNKSADFFGGLVTAQTYGVGAIIIAVNPSYRHCERSEAIQSTYECWIASLRSQ